MKPFCAQLTLPQTFLVFTLLLLESFLEPQMYMNLVFSFSYLSFSIFTVYNDDMLTEPIKKIPFLLYRDAHHNIRSPLKVNYAENAHTTLDHNESLITFRSRMHFPNTWRRMMMVGYLNACCKYTLLSLTFYLYLVVQK